MRFSKRNLHSVFLSYLCWREREKQKKGKKKWKRPKNPIKRFFVRWSSKNVKIKKGFFCKNWLTLFVSGREKKHAFSCTLSVLAKFVWPKQCKPRSTIKIGVSAEIGQNQKWHLFFWKRCFFDMVENLGFTSCVFEKLCFFLFFCFFLFLFCFCFCFFLGGFKGQMRWPKGPPHLALNPPYFLLFLVFFFFLLFLLSFLCF